MASFPLTKLKPVEIARDNKPFLFACLVRALSQVVNAVILPFMAALYASNYHPNVIGNGFAIYAAVALLGSWIGGLLLDQGVRWQVVFSLGSVFIGAGSLALGFSDSTLTFYLAFAFEGIGIGIFGPAAELAVDETRRDSLIRGRAYTFARMAESLINILISLILVVLVLIDRPHAAFWISFLVCILAIAIALNQSLFYSKAGSQVAREVTSRKANRSHIKFRELQKSIISLLRSRFTIAIVLTALFAGILQLESSAMPIELDRIGLQMSKSQFLLITISLLAFQQVMFAAALLPVGLTVARLPVRRGLQFGFFCYAIAMLSLSLASWSYVGWLLSCLLLVLVQVATAVAKASIMPSSIRAALELSPKERHGLAMAFYAQSYNIAGLIATPLGGYFLERHQDTSFWFVLCLLCLPAVLFSGLVRSVPLTSPRQTSPSSKR
jgi:MFS family permease